MRAPLLAALLEHVSDAVFAPNVFLAVLASRCGQDPCNIPVRHRARAGGTTSIRPARIARIMVRCLIELIRFRRGAFARFEKAPRT